MTLQLETEDTGIRSRVHKAAVLHVPRAYKLEKTSDPSKQRLTAARVKTLLAQSSFHYEVIQRRVRDINAEYTHVICLFQDPDQRVGRFQHQIISDIIWEVFFSHANALGCLYQEYFRPISHQLLALVLTTVSHTPRRLILPMILTELTGASCACYVGDRTKNHKTVLCCSLQGL